MADTFQGVTRPGTQESLLQYVSRCLAKALTDYPMLSGRTRLVFPASCLFAIPDFIPYRHVNTCKGDDG
ncbi:hypothetical protein ACMVI2_004225 [Salmonella enterica]